MCGIAGVLGGDVHVVGPMIGALTHRGPDGVRIEGGLAHARLAIIDLEGGWQPLHAAGAAVVGNGELYNSVELAAEFGLDGVLATGSDFEPFLHLTAREGPAAIDRLRGMYAQCLVLRDGRAFLSRDPFGIKPLYLMQHGGGLAFASEPRAFFAAGMMQPVLDVEAARELLELNYTLGGRTLFQGLRRVAPGETIEVRGGQIVASHRKAPFGRRTAPDDEAGLLRALDGVLEDSVKVHQRADVPYGLVLSGGIDSAAIATLMARLTSAPPRRPSPPR